MIYLRKPLAFIYRDFLNETSYKLAFLMELFGIFLSVLSFYFLSKLFGQAVVPHLKPYGGNYFPFVLIGIAFSGYLQVSLNTFAGNIRSAQTTGTLEALLVTQTGIPAIIISSSLYSFIHTSFRVVVYLLLGLLIFGVNMKGANILAAVVILALTIITFSSIGIISASFIMVIKKGDPVTWIFTSLSWLLGGVIYPVTILPDWLQKFSYLLPITHSLEGMRLALLKGLSTNTLLPHILALTLFSVVLLPISVGLFGYGVKRAKIDGSLTHY
jgi:ABC-2 type transport system permease protein